MDHLDANASRQRGDPWLYDRHRPALPMALVDALTRRLGADQPRVVDLACGTGNSTRVWIGRASRLVGVDANPEQLEVARTRSPQVEFRRAFAHDTGLADESFDIITCVQALHWLEPGPTFREIRRLLRAGGLFAAIHADLLPESSEATRTCASRAAEIVRSGGLAGAQNLWSEEDFTSHFESLGRMEEFELEAPDSFDMAGRLRTAGDVATALAAGVSEEELGLDRVSGRHEGLITFHVRAAFR